MTRDHDEFELLLEKQHHGAASVAELGELDAHLQACAACRLYATELTRDEASMNSSTETFTQTYDWARSERALTRAIALQRQKQTLYTSLLCGWAMVIGWIALRDASSAAEAAAMLAAGLAPMLLLWLSGRAAMARILRAELAVGEDRIAADVEQEARARRARRVGAAAAAFGLLAFGAGAVYLDGWMRAAAILWLLVMLPACYQLLWSRQARARNAAYDRGAQD